MPRQRSAKYSGQSGDPSFNRLETIGCAARPWLRRESQATATGGPLFLRRTVGRLQVTDHRRRLDSEALPAFEAEMNKLFSASFVFCDSARPNDGRCSMHV